VIRIGVFPTRHALALNRRGVKRRKKVWGGLLGGVLAEKKEFKNVRFVEARGGGFIFVSHLDKENLGKNAETSLWETLDEGRARRKQRVIKASIFNCLGVWQVTPPKMGERGAKEKKLTCFFRMKGGKKGKSQPKYRSGYFHGE